jgi:VIT1/CCC1 family predicted Fe2+/Mn2+ transporter
VDEFDYIPDGAWSAGDAPYGTYTGPGSAQSSGPYRGAGQSGYVPYRANGVPQGGPTNGRPAPGRQPGGVRNGQGYPPSASGPRPAYQPYQPYQSPNARLAAGYPPPGSGPMPAYRPGTGPMREYRPDNSGPMPAYRTEDSGPMPAYQQPKVRPAPRYRHTDTSLLSGYPPISDPMAAYPPPADRPTAGYPLPHVKPIMGWLPFGGRLVLLPKDLDPDGADTELREHRDVSGGALRPAVFGAMDGLVTNASLIAGIGGGGGGHGMIVLTGIAGLIAGAFSMATGEYISVKSQNELTQAEVELEKKQHARDPAAKLRRLAEVFVEKGVSPNLAEAVVRQISADPDRAVLTHVREELGIDPDDLPSPQTAAIASFGSFTVGALLPLSPFLVGYPSLKAALVIAGATAFIGGAALAKLVGRSTVLGGLRQFTAAFLATGAAFVVGHLISGHVPM